jgi:hypothetical protein
MIVTRSSSDVRRVPGASARPGHDVWVTGYMGKHTGAALPAPEAAMEQLFPDAYVIEQGAGVFGPPHFHRANEFQLVMKGAGTLGRKPVRPYVVHYAGAYTPYGPIDPGPEGIGYLTLRTLYDPGARNLPEHREQLHAARRKPRAHVSEPLPVGAARTPAAETVCEEIFAPEPDGLAALLYRVPANASIVGPDPATGGGQYWVVLDGTMRAPDGALLPSHSCVFVSQDEPAQRFAAAAAPLDVLVMQFPTHQEPART